MGRCVLAPLPSLWMHTGAPVLCHRVWELLLGSPCSTASTAQHSAQPGLLSAATDSSTALLFLPRLGLINSLLVFLRQLGSGVLLINTFALIFCTALGSCPQGCSRDGHFWVVNASGMSPAGVSREHLAAEAAQGAGCALVWRGRAHTTSSAGCPAVSQGGSGGSRALQHGDVADRAGLG